MSTRMSALRVFNSELLRKSFHVAMPTIMFLRVQVMNATFMPVVVSVGDPAYDDRHVLDVFFDDLMVGYSIGQPHGDRLMTWNDFSRLELSRRELRRRAAGCLDRSMRGVAIHGQPPALMASFDGIESSLLLADDFWESLAGAVPGSIVIGVPARDALIITGSRSTAGIAKVHRAVDRMYLAGHPHLVTPSLLIRNRGTWERF